MKAIIPMAGSGTRLRPLTHSRPKAMLLVGSRPIIAHIVDALLPLGCDTIIPVVGHEGGDAIVAYLRGRYPQLSVKTVVQEEKLGLGHAVLMAKKAAAGDEVIVMYGDTILEGTLDGFVDRTVDAVIAVREVEDPRRFGVVNTEGGFITRFVEKPEVPESNLAIVGCNYIRESDLLFAAIEDIMARHITTHGEYQLTDAFQVMLDGGARFKPYTLEGWYDAGTPETLLATNRRMLAREGNTTAIPGTVVIPPVFVGEDVAITASVIGPDVSIGDHAVIERSVIADSIIGEHAHVTDAILNGSLVGQFATVEDRPRKIYLGDHSVISLGSD